MKLLNLIIRPKYKWVRANDNPLTMADLGPKQIIKLNTAGLKVGEILCRAGLECCSRREAVEMSIEECLGQNFNSEQKLELGLHERVKGDVGL